MADKRTLTALLLGDVLGQPGCRALFIGLPQLIKQHRADIVVVNGENADHGFGLTDELARQFFSLGVHVITSGNHIWQRDEFRGTLEKDERILRPANYPSSAPGHGSVILDIKGMRVGVINLQGRMQMGPLDCPFQVASSLVDKMKKNTDAILIDFHAEVPQEKETLALYLDGRVSLVVGTHTHVQTLDERILPKGTAYITDMGMCGPLDSVIGSNPMISIKRQLTQIPFRNEIVDAPAHLQGVVVKIDVSTKKALSITRIKENFSL
ncbi:MAG: TIGR00282 family metallophosphoesterase [Bacteroidales bacterium]|jgi:metallophosphoesterase (TIGR00282 family)|nr:TIGR00282 family metallophosphoesterase [Bacteroidales bacterium]